MAGLTLLMDGLREHQKRMGNVEGLRLWQIKRQLDANPNLLIIVTRKGDNLHHWIGIEESGQPLREMRALTVAQFDELTTDAELIIINDTSMYYRWKTES